MSYRSACLHCSFFDKDLSEYIQWKKRNSGPLPLKYAVAHVGVQEDGTWVVGENGCISPNGKHIPIEESHYIWISNVYNGLGVAAAAQQCKIELPLTSDHLRILLGLLREASQHNFIPSLLLIAGILIYHYYTHCMRLFTLVYRNSNGPPLHPVHRASNQLPYSNRVWEKWNRENECSSLWTRPARCTRLSILSQFVSR